MIGAAGTNVESAQAPGETACRPLHQRIAADCARLRELPAAEQKRAYAAARANSPTLFALLQRLRQDALARGLIDAAARRTRAAPSESELGRAVTRGFASAFRAGRHGFRDAAASVLARLADEFGVDNAARVRLSDLQRAYLAGAGRARAGSFDAVAVVMSVGAIDALRAGPATAGLPRHAGEVARPAPDAVPGQDVLTTLLLAACRHLEGGARNAGELADALVCDLGEPARALARDCYEAIRHCPGIAGPPPRADGPDEFRLAA